jgi:tol-pal system protein YbgF
MLKLSSIFIVPLVLITLLFAGSVNAQENPYAIETKVIKNEQAIQSLRQQQANLYLKMEDLLVKYGELLGKIQDMSHRLDAIEARINSLASGSGNMQTMNKQQMQSNPYSTTQNNTTNMQPKQAGGNAIPQIAKPSQQTLPTVPKSKSTAIAQNQPPKQKVTTQLPKIEKKPVVPSDKMAYLAAKKLYDTKRYRAAINAFSNFKRQFKTSKYLPDAIFYLAQSHFNIGEYDKAIISYDYLINTYPKNRNVPEALLREGISFIKLGDTIDGKYLLKKTINSYPNSKEAIVAKRYLSNLK